MAYLLAAMYVGEPNKDIGEGSGDEEKHDQVNGNDGCQEPAQERDETSTLTVSPTMSTMSLRQPSVTSDDGEVLNGASRITGGKFRGRAKGNTVNIAGKL
jgi:hypothetical protein